MSSLAPAPPEATPAGTSSDRRREALGDLRADFEELLFLVRSGDAALAAAASELNEARGRLPAPTLELLAAQIASARSRYGASGRRLLALRQLAASDRAPGEARVAELVAEKAAFADRIRTEQALSAALASAGDWQSPSFLHSVVPAAGRQSGRIRAHWNDRHLDAEAYEHAYRTGMIVAGPGVRALLTSCGMAAFTTVLSFLLMEGKLSGPALIGSGLYHESRQLLDRALAGRLHTVDERDTRRLLRSIDELRPSAVFLDSLSNTRWMPVPDLDAVIDRLRGRETYLVVDNTGLSVSCQPFAEAGDQARLIVFESLLKYAQLGLDRANAGVIVARAEDAEALAGYREHLGTNIPDVAAHALPRPERWVLERRLARLGRNAQLLAERLAERAGDLVDVVHPGLPGHPCHAIASRHSFRGGWLSLVFRNTDGDLARERRFLAAAVAEAARQGVSLLGGSSFGFNTTRVYLAAARTAHGLPFVRIAAGTEHVLEVEALADILGAALRDIS